MPYAARRHTSIEPFEDGDCLLGDDRVDEAGGFPDPVVVEAAHQRRHVGGKRLAQQAHGVHVTTDADHVGPDLLGDRRNLVGDLPGVLLPRVDLASLIAPL